MVVLRGPNVKCFPFDLKFFSFVCVRACVCNSALGVLFPDYIIRLIVHKLFSSLTQSPLALISPSQLNIHYLSAV